MNLERLKYTRIFSDPEGESHFEDLEYSLGLVDFAPPAPPVYLSTFHPAARVAFLALPPGFFGDWHPTPARQLMVIASGESEVETSDGAVRRFRTGDIALVEDATGKGHRSRILGTGPYVNVVVQLPTG